MDSVSGVSFGSLSGIDTNHYKNQDMQDSTGTVGAFDQGNIDLMRNSSISGEHLDFGA